MLHLAQAKGGPFYTRQNGPTKPNMTQGRHRMSQKRIKKTRENASRKQKSQNRASPQPWMHSIGARPVEQEEDSEADRVRSAARNQVCAVAGRDTRTNKGRRRTNRAHWKRGAMRENVACPGIWLGSVPVSFAPRVAAQKLARRERQAPAWQPLPSWSSALR